MNVSRDALGDPSPARNQQASSAIEPGLRARKKQETRRQIYEAASRLFAARGFDAVPVAEIASTANVSVVTVFNYFPTKEDLVFAGMESFEERIIDAVATLALGESALTAVRRIVVDGIGHIADPSTAATIAKGATLIADSSTLQSRQRDIVARYIDDLAGLLAVETGVPTDSTEPRVVATALLATHQAVVARAHVGILKGRRGRQLVAEVRAEADAAFAVLEGGLGDFAIRGRGPT